MLTNYLVIGLRNLSRNKTFSAINIIGLGIGMAACFLIVQYVHFEWNYDSNHRNRDRIFRVTVENVTPTETTMIATNSPAAGPALKQDLPEVEEFARLLPQSIFLGESVACSTVGEPGDQKVFNENNIYCADPAVLTMFDFPFVYGDPATALNDLSSLVLSESESKKFFGDQDPRGKTMVLDGWKTLTVTGVFRDVPENSHIRFDMLVGYFFRPRPGAEENLSALRDEANWKWAEFFTYVQLSPRADKQKLESKMDNLIERYSGEYLKRMSIKEHQAAR